MISNIGKAKKIDEIFVFEKSYVTFVASLKICKIRLSFITLITTSYHEKQDLYNLKTQIIVKVLINSGLFF